MVCLRNMRMATLNKGDNDSNNNNNNNNVKSIYGRLALKTPYIFRPYTLL